MATPERRPFAVVGHGSIFDGIAYWATLAGVYLMVGGLMFYSGKEKLFDDDGHPPQYVVAQFKGTFIDTFPGTHAAWIILGVLEFGVFVLLLASLVPAPPEQVAAPGRPRGCAARVRVSRVRTDGHEAVRRDRVALHLLRRHGGDPDPRLDAAAEPLRPLARRDPVALP